MEAAEQRPDTDLAEAVDHVSAALTRIRAGQEPENVVAPSERPESQVAHASERSGDEE